MIEPTTAATLLRQPASFAAGVRLPYAELPEPVRSWIAAQLDAPITQIVDRQGGFSPGVAATVRSSSGSGLFVKAVSGTINADSLRMYRNERDRGLRLPRLPGILKPNGSTEILVADQQWIVITFPLLEGSTPRHPWSSEDAVRVLDAILALQRQLTPSPWREDGQQTADMIDFLSGWQKLAATHDDPWSADPWILRHLESLSRLERQVLDRIPGDTLCHWDLRADNIMITTDAVWLVDWAHARNAAAWVDPVLLLADVVSSRAGGGDESHLDVEGLLAHPVFEPVSADQAVGLIGSLGAALHLASRKPAPPGLATIRNWQRLTSDAILEFVRTVHAR